MPTPPDSFFAWKEEYCLHHAVIDKQHQQLVRLVGELHGSVVAGEPRQAHAQRLATLYIAAKAHFTTEEQLLRLHRYPRYLVHKAAHDGLAHALDGVREEVATGKRELTLDYVELIQLWPVYHFGEFDAPCAQFLRD
jgi:hemerythrin-like metal-binding protein